jgi:tetratricopeptide (TPR) repeat protein
VQDPFVLYRSYLWAIGIPGTVFMIFHGPSARVLLAVGVAVAALLVWQALDRVLSLENAEAAWSDAIRKLPGDPRSVGRWFPYLNRGSAYADADSFELALRDFEASSSLGDLGMGQFNIGSILAAKGKPREALAAFDRAAAQGYTGYNLPFQRGLALAALGRRDEALREFRETVRERPPSPTREAALLALGRAAIEANKPDEGVRALEELAQIQPANREARYLLGMAYVAQGEAARARQVFDKLLIEQANPRLFYARAVANFKLRDKAGALSDIENAIRMGGDNPNLRAWRERILAMP